MLNARRYTNGWHRFYRSARGYTPTLIKPLKEHTEPVKPPFHAEITRLKWKGSSFTSHLKKNGFHLEKIIYLFSRLRFNYFRGFPLFLKDMEASALYTYIRARDIFEECNKKFNEVVQNLLRIKRHGPIPLSGVLLRIFKQYNNENNKKLDVFVLEGTIWKWAKSRETVSMGFAS